MPDGFAADPQQAADLEHDADDLSVLVEHNILDIADLVALYIVDGRADQLIGTQIRCSLAAIMASAGGGVAGASSAAMSLGGGIVWLGRARGGGTA